MCRAVGGVYVWSPKREDIAADNKLWVFVELAFIIYCFWEDFFSFQWRIESGFLYDLPNRDKCDTEG